jgi:hypothetical protein
MGSNNEKHGSPTYSASPISPNEPLSAVSRTSGYQSLADFEKKDLVSKAAS